MCDSVRRRTPASLAAPASCSSAALRTLCAALDRAVFPYFEREEDECPSRLRDDVFGTEPR
jgi:hypothetical protein